MVNFAVGLGSFLGGVQQGMQARQTFDQAQDAKRVRKMERAATDEATAARERDIGDLTRGPAIPADPAGTPDEKGAVPTFGGNAQPISRDQAEAKVGGFMDYYRSTAVPKLIEGYVQNGQPEKAAQLETYMDSKEGGQRFKSWAQSAQRFAMGDMEGGFKGLTDLNKGLNNGVDIVGYEPITQTKKIKLGATGAEIDDPSGEPVPTGGWRVRWKDTGSDKEFTQDFESPDDFARTAMWATSPEQQVAYSLGELKDARSARAKAAEQARDYRNDIGKIRFGAVLKDQEGSRDAARTLNRDATLHGYRMKEDEVGHGYRLEEQSSGILLRAANKVAEDTGESPEDVRKSIETITKRLAETDMSFGKLPPDEQTQRAVSVLTAQRNSARGVIGATPAGQPSRGAVPTLY